MGAMWANVMNGGNPSQVLQFLVQFASKDFVLRNVFYLPTELRDQFPTAQSKNNSFDTALHWAYICSMLPDVTCTIHQSQIIQCAGSVGSIIRLAVQYEGTSAFQLQSPYSNALQTLESAWVHEQGSPTLPVLDMSKLKSLLTRCPPLRMVSNGFFVLHLNATNVITEMEYHWKEISVTPVLF